MSEGQFSESVMHMPKEGKLTIDQLAEALYEGTPHLSNLAEKLARQHGRASALTFYRMTSEDVRNFWRTVAKMLIDHSSEWEPNQGSCCVLSKAERERLRALPSVIPAPDRGKK